MLHRSASSQHRRSSGSGMTSTAPKGRRASVAAEKPIAVIPMVPNIALDPESDSPEEETNPRILSDGTEMCGLKNTMLREPCRSPRNSLVPEDYCRNLLGIRNSVTQDVIRSPRNGSTHDISHSPRHSLVPDSPMNRPMQDLTFNRSPRNSVIALTASRTSLVPENGAVILNRVPRYSLIPDSSLSPRGSVANLEFHDRSPRESICLERTKTRGSITAIDATRASRSSITSEGLTQNQRGSITPEASRSRRGSIAPESNRSPRASICPESNRSPRSSIIQHEQLERYRRESNGGVNGEEIRSSRNSIGPDIITRSPRGSLGRIYDRRDTKSSLTPEDPRRSSADQGTTRNRSPSPYRQRDLNSDVRSAVSAAQVNLGYGPDAESRRGSSSVSQFSADVSRRLCTSVPEKCPENGNFGVVTYGSVVFQLKDANLEADSTCDFVCRALKVVWKTRIFTVFLGCFLTMPILMFIFGLKFYNDCPEESRIPIYMIVGGGFGMVYVLLLLYTQIRSRRPKVPAGPSRPHVSVMHLSSVTLTCFLIGWFVFGNYWILRIKWPSYYKRVLYSPNEWCHRNFYIFSLVHLYLMYAVLVGHCVVAIGLAFYRIFDCLLPERYK